MSFNYNGTNGYPTSEDLVAKLISGSAIKLPMDELSALLDLNGAVAGAIARFERFTGYAPFWSGGADVDATARIYDLPPVNAQINGAANGISGNGYGGYWYGFNCGRMWDLDLEAGAVAVTIVEAGTTIYTIGPGDPNGIQTSLLPQNARALNKPFQVVRFYQRPWTTGPQTLSITARWGYCDTMPADAWNAILNRAALQVVPELIMRLRGLVAQWTEADVTEKYFDNPFKDSVTFWEKDYREVSVWYKRFRQT